VNYAIEMGSGVLCMSGFVKIGSGIQKLLRGYTHTDTDSKVIS
jgi:hypothetical protein